MVFLEYLGIGFEHLSGECLLFAAGLAYISKNRRLHRRIAPLIETGSCFTTCGAC